MATDYNDGKIHGWNGGECPVHPKSEVSLWWNNGEPDHGVSADQYKECYWHHDERNPNEEHIIAFRVTKPYRAPREWWVNLRNSGEHEAFPSHAIASMNTKTDHIECIHVREVTDAGTA